MKNGKSVTSNWQLVIGEEADSASVSNEVMREGASGGKSAPITNYQLPVANDQLPVTDFVDEEEEEEKKGNESHSPIT